MSVRRSHMVLCGDVFETMQAIPDETVQTSVTSPPYYRLRDYGEHDQLGLEDTPEEYLHKLWTLYDEVYRVLRPDGTIWVNLGDCYAGSNGNGWKQSLSTVNRSTSIQEGNRSFNHGKTSAFVTGNRSIADQALRAGAGDVPAKSMMMIPERFAWGMIQRGWILRKKIAWCKRSAMPESVTDRPTSAWEVIYLFSKTQRYYYDAYAVRQKGIVGRQQHFRSSQYENNKAFDNSADRTKTVKRGPSATDDLSANLRDYWLLGPEPSKVKHYATYPRELPRRCIKASTSAMGQCPACGSPYVRLVEKTTEGRDASRPDKRYPGEMPNAATGGYVSVKTIGWQPSCRCAAGDPIPQIVLDPFTGTGTSQVVAQELGRSSIGIEIVPRDAEIARQRLRGMTRIAGVKR